MLNHSQSGRVQGMFLAFLGAIGVLAVLAFLLIYDPHTQDQSSLMVYCAAGLKEPVSKIAEAYEEEFGVSVQISYAGSGTHLANIQINPKGDLYIPADDSYIALARGKNLVQESFPAAVQTAVLAFRKGNPKNIQSLDDLKRSDLKFAQANPDQAAIGKLTRKSLQALNLWEAMQPQISVFKPTVNDVASDVKLGTVDAAFVWDAFLPLYPDLESLPSLKLNDAVANVTVGVLRKSDRPAAALRFARYMTAPEKGARIWEDSGLTPVPGDKWAARPELRLMSGAMLRLALDDTIQAFMEREGVKITTVYNGCGILVTQMKAGERPDAYFSCDTSFMVDVEDMFLQSEDISKNRLVLVVAKGNPKNVKSLNDLTRPDLKVGVGHPTKGAMGALTKKVLEEKGLYEEVVKKLAVESPTGDFLINQLRTGSLDVGIAYITNVSAARDHLDTIEIDMPEAVAVQPIAVGKESYYPKLMGRLIEAIKTAESKQSFETNGFNWLVK